MRPLLFLSGYALALLIRLIGLGIIKSATIDLERACRSGRRGERIVAKSERLLDRLSRLLA